MRNAKRYTNSFNLRKLSRHKRRSTWNDMRTAKVHTSLRVRVGLVRTFAARLLSVYNLTDARSQHSKGLGLIFIVQMFRLVRDLGFWILWFVRLFVFLYPGKCMTDVFFNTWAEKKHDVPRANMSCVYFGTLQSAYLLPSVYFLKDSDSQVNVGLRPLQTT